MHATRSITVGFISLGCAKNLVDSEIIATGLTAAGFRLASAPKCADVVIVNTCAFVRDAKAESIDAVLEVCAWKQRGRCRAVLVAGCLPQRYRREIQALLPEVDAFIGLDELNQAGVVIRRVLRGERSVAVIAPRAQAVLEPSGHRLLFTGAPYAYVKIAEGCNHTCAFCAIPQIRGRYRSRPIKSIVAEAEDLLSRGIRELNLIAQDTTSYGLDLGARTNLPALLRALGRIGGRFWIRVLYGHPAHVTAALMDTMSVVEQVCRYLDLPIQHSDAAILRAMCRPSTAERLRRTFGYIRAALPGVTLRTTCLVGFPGETERQFRNLLAFLEEIRFDHVAVFTYSKEENTSAARLPRPVPTVEAQRRKQWLMLRQKRIVDEAAMAQIGRSDDLLVERYDRKRRLWVARSRGQAPDVDGVVYLSVPVDGLTPGALIRGRYVAVAGYDLKAIIDNEAHKNFEVATKVK
ncbi:MAG: 30S ribosomal protein S12 methylthiotransferase RimO [Verrucomicrobia bacterium]|nr:30S ribosomal protein S12 methylthiotransferase RimO [Verrucomicrobiota bacterium]MBU1856401.1 30S ribosomal protein S12 methylthiotransferase RimO [Verrucomicrobiota bacterium]